MRLFALTAAFHALLTAAAFAQTAEINVFTPGVVYNAGIQDLAAAYTRETGIKVTIKAEGMGQLVNDVKKGTPIADIVVAPVSFMDGMQADGTVVSGTAADIGRVHVGLAVKKGAPHPDISTPARLGAALKAGGVVMYSNPAGGSMEARIIDDMLHQYPYFQGVRTKISTKGEGGEALVRGEGDMALQLICEVLNHPELELVGTVPEELHAYIDTSVAVSARSAQADAARAFIAYMLRSDHAALWKSKGLERKP
ncbi:MAG TPA: substrate-binding domain-containing protein [Rhizomicrobium sp.]|jgi:molybdate transport system substrate-binding protein